jgi:hypothetical protein
MQVLIVIGGSNVSPCIRRNLRRESAPNRARAARGSRT